MKVDFRETVERVEMDLQARIVEAARVLGSLPDDRPTGYRSNWPETLRDRIDVMALALEKGGRHEDMVAPRFQPSAAAIDRTDEVIGWLLGLTVEERKLVFGAAVIKEVNRFRRWKILGKRIGISPGAAAKRHKRAIGKLVGMVLK